MEDSQSEQMLPHQDAYKLIPCSMLPTFLCCVMYDRYPINVKNIDITVCLQGGRVVELYQRECVSSINISNVTKFNDIQIIRNNKGQLFYLIEAGHEVIVLSSTDKLSVYRRFSEVTHYKICDPECSGEAKLMIKSNLSTLYITFSDVEHVSRDVDVRLEHTKPVIVALAKKLTEMRYNLDCHAKAYKQIEKLRQHASFLCHGDGALQLKTSKPVVIFCDKNIIIQLEVENLYTVSLNKVSILIHNSNCNSISYTSKVYKHLSMGPFYKEIELREIQSKCKASIVAVIPISEFKSSVSSRVDFSGIISYEREGKEYLQSFDSVHISAGEVMGRNFDVFNSSVVDERSMCIAMLSSTIKTNLCLKQKGLGDMISLSTIFHKYLEMDLLGDKKTMAIHKHSPYHILHGILIIFDDDNENIDVSQNEINYNIVVYTRSPSQVLALIHFIYDKVPLTLVVTTPNILVTPHGDSDDDIGHRKVNYDYTESAKSLLKQSSMTIDYLDKCLFKSSSIENADVQIDLFAMGSEEFAKYRNIMIAEAENCFQLLFNSPQTSDIVEEEVMEID